VIARPLAARLPKREIVWLPVPPRRAANAGPRQQLAVINRVPAGAHIRAKRSRVKRVLG